MAVGFYVVSCLGVTVGYHRHLTHRAFTARRGLRVALAVAGGLAAQGPVIGWVSDHRRHHAFSDRDGDPHSPWAYGTGPIALAKGFWHAHMGWLFERVNSNAERFAPDLLADRDLRAIDRPFPLWIALSIAIRRSTLVGDRRLLPVALAAVLRCVRHRPTGRRPCMRSH